MLGWSIAILRGGALAADAHPPHITGAEQLLYIGSIPDLWITRPLHDIQGSTDVRRYGDGYPVIWQLPAGRLTAFLEGLDLREPHRLNLNRTARQQFADHQIPDSELVFVEAWDQS